MQRDTDCHCSQTWDGFNTVDIRVYEANNNEKKPGLTRVTWLYIPTLVESYNLKINWNCKI